MFKVAWVARFREGMTRAGFAVRAMTGRIPR